MGRVVVVGSVNEDLVLRCDRLPRAGETVTGGELTRLGGGKGGNQAVAASRLGADVVLVAAVGEGSSGERLIGELASEGVGVAALARAPGVESGLAVVLVDHQGENQIVIHPGANAAITSDVVSNALGRIDLQPGDVLLSCLEVPRAAVTTALVAAREAEAAAILNLSPVPQGVDDLLACRPVVVVNQHEAVRLVGDGPPVDLVHRLAHLCGNDAVVTLGAAGAVAAMGGEVCGVEGVVVEAVDTTGAGDTFCGALAAFLSSGLGPRDSLLWGVRAAAMSVRRLGARAGMPTLDMLGDAFDPHRRIT
jgi:ribokinase